MTDNRKKKLSLLGICLVLLVAVFMAATGDYNIAYKNDRLKVPLPYEADKKTAEIEFTLPVIYLHSYEIEKLLPLWQWTADGPHMPLREESAVDVYVFDRGVNHIDDVPTQVYLSTTMKLRGRTSSYLQDKKPFSMEIHDYRTGESDDAYFLGLGPESDFVYHAPYIDRSLIRNYIAYTLQRQLLDWAPQCRLAEVFLAKDGTEEVDMTNYQGVYLIVEKIKKGKNSINISDFVTSSNADRQFADGGGYIFKRDHFEPGYDTAIRLADNSLGNGYSLVYPKSETATDRQIQTIFTEIENCEETLYNGSYEQAAQYFDMEQFAYVFLLNEFVKNKEGMAASTFFYRTKGGKIKVVQWDFDIGTGNSDFDRSLDNARKWQVINRRQTQSFVQHPEFRQLLVSTWEELRSEGGLLSEENIDALLADVENQLDGAWQRNDAAWPQLWETVPYMNSENNDCKNSLEEREYIKAFLTERGRWMDEHIYDILGWE